MRQFDSAHFAEIRQSLHTSEVRTGVPFTDACLASTGTGFGSLVWLSCYRVIAIASRQISARKFEGVMPTILRNTRAK